MGPRHIVAILTGDTADETVLRCALSVGRRFNGHVDAVHGAPLAERAAAALAGVGGMPAATTGLIAAEENRIMDRRSRAETAYRNAVGSVTEQIKLPPPGEPTVSLIIEHALPTEAAAWHGNSCDLVVIARPSDGDDAALRDLAETMLLDTGTPLLLVPPQGDGLDRCDSVLVAWDGSAPATRAVHDAMPFLAQAKTVDVISIDVDPEALEPFVRSLGWNGLQPNVNRLGKDDGGVADILLAHLGQHDTDLLVMGGFGHSRLREFFLGGVSETMLNTCPVPFLMSH